MVPPLPENRISFSKDVSCVWEVKNELHSLKHISLFPFLPLSYISTLVHSFIRSCTLKKLFNKPVIVIKLLRDVNQGASRSSIMNEKNYRKYDSLQYNCALTHRHKFIISITSMLQIRKPRPRRRRIYLMHSALRTQQRYFNVQTVLTLPYRTSCSRKWRALLPTFLTVSEL